MQPASLGRVAVSLIGVVVLASVLLQTTGCAGRGRVSTKVRDDGTTTHTLANIEIMIEGGSEFVADHLRGRSKIEKRCVLDVRASEKPGGKTTFELAITYTAVDALNIEPGRSLEVVADLNSYVLSAGSSARKTRDPSGRYFTESLSYPVSADLLISMAEARTVLVAVKGYEGEAKGYFDTKNFADFRRFVDDYVRVR